MGRNNLSEEYGAESSRPDPAARRRYVAIAVGLVLSLTAAGAVAQQSGWLSDGSCAEGEVRLDVVASPDMAPVLRAAADYSRQHEITSDGNCLDIRVRAEESYETASRLSTAKKSEAEVWVPDSQVWVQGLTDTVNTALPLTAAGNVASTPLAVAASAEQAEELGAPQKTYSWGDLAEASLRKDGLRLGAADPSRNATGLLALTRLRAPTGKPADQREAHGAQLANSLRDHVSESDAALLDTLAREPGAEDEPDRNDAIVVTEQAAFRHNAAAKQSADDLRLLYPKDGTPRLDYPYTLVDEAAMSTDESRAALRFMTLLGETSGRKILHEHGFRTTADSQVTDVATAAGARSPQPYDDENIQQPSPGDIQNSLGMWTITVQSVRLTTLVDVSASMGLTVPEQGRSRMALTTQSLLEGVKAFTSEDEMGLWRFASDVDGAKDYEQVVPTRALGSGSQRQDLEDGLDGLQPLATSASGLYDSVLAAYQKAMQTHAREKFNVLVLITDGTNDEGTLSRSALLRRLREIADPDKPLPIIAFAVGPDASRDDADEIAAATGGTSQQIADPSQINAVILKAIMEAGVRAQR